MATKKTKKTKKTNEAFDLNRLRGPLVGLGIGIIVLVLIADPIGLSAKGFSNGQILAGLFGALLIVMGGLGHRVAGAYQGLALMLLNTIVVLLVIEIGAGVLSYAISRGSDDDPGSDPRLSQPYYADQEWSAAYWNDFSAAEKFAYAPYVV